MSNTVNRQQCNSIHYAEGVLAPCLAVHCDSRCQAVFNIFCRHRRVQASETTLSSPPPDAVRSLHALMEHRLTQQFSTTTTGSKVNLAESHTLISRKDLRASILCFEDVSYHAMGAHSCCRECLPSAACLCIPEHLWSLSHASTAACRRQGVPECFVGNVIRYCIVCVGDGGLFEVGFLQLLSQVACLTAQSEGLQRSQRRTGRWCRLTIPDLKP